MDTFLYIALIALSILLTGLVMMQIQGGNMGGLYGQDTTVYRTRRGLEKTLYQATIVVSVLFFIVAIVAAVVVG